jgi:hypothetical protein
MKGAKREEYQGQDQEERQDSMEEVKWMRGWKTFWVDPPDTSEGEG